MFAREGREPGESRPRFAQPDWPNPEVERERGRKSLPARQQLEIAVAASALAVFLACVRFPVFPRMGLEHYVLQETGPDAVRCGAFTREWGEPHELSAEEEAVVSRCMTEAHAEGKHFYFHLGGPGIDSQLARGLLMRPQGLASFRYDSAPCGGNACAESFVMTDCPTPARGQPIRPEDDGCPAG